MLKSGMRHLSLLLIILIITACHRHPKYRSDANEFKNMWNSSDFDKRFPLHDLTKFDGDSLVNTIANVDNKMDSVDFLRLLPDSTKDGVNGSPYYGYYYCSRQIGNSQFNAYTYLLTGNMFTDIVWVNYDLKMKPISAIVIAGDGGDDGVGANIDSKLLNDSVLLRSYVMYDGSGYFQNTPYYSYIKDSIVEKFFIKPNGIFKSIDNKSYHSVKKIRNDNFKKSLDSSYSK